MKNRNKKRENPTCGFPSFVCVANEIHPFGRYLTIGNFDACGHRLGTLSQDPASLLKKA